MRRRDARTRACPRGNRGGFTLLEVLVALAVIATAYTALLGLHARNLRTIARDQAYTRALFLARELIAEVELEGYPEAGTASGDFEDTHPGQYQGYRWERTVLDLPIAGTREVDVRVIPPADESAACELTLFVRR